MIYLMFTGLIGVLTACFIGVRLPNKCSTMSKEEYLQYFRKDIMGMTNGNN